MKKVEATVILSKCSKTHKTYGIRAEKKEDGKWHFTWAFKIDDSRAKKEGYDKTKISGKYVEDETYKGCPYCGSKDWFICGECGMPNCYDGIKQTVSCNWCGYTSELSYREDIELIGGEM